MVNLKTKYSILNISIHEMDHYIKSVLNSNCQFKYHSTLKIQNHIQVLRPTFYFIKPKPTLWQLSLDFRALNCILVTLNS